MTNPDRDRSLRLKFYKLAFRFGGHLEWHYCEHWQERQLISTKLYQYCTSARRRYSSGDQHFGNESIGSGFQRDSRHRPVSDLSYQKVLARLIRAGSP